MPFFVIVVCKKYSGNHNLKQQLPPKRQMLKLDIWDYVELVYVFIRNYGGGNISIIILKAICNHNNIKSNKYDHISFDYCCLTLLRLIYI